MPERKGHGIQPENITEFFPTFPDLAKLITGRVIDDFHIEPKMVLEPGCGTGSFMQGIRTLAPKATIFGVEIDPCIGEYARRQQFMVEVDNLLAKQWGKFDLIIGNPPFSLSEDFIHHLRDQLTEDGKLVFLLRLNFLATQERYATLWAKYPPERVYPLVSRPGFTSDGSTDGTDYGIVVWGKDPCIETTMRWMDNRQVESRWSQGKRAVKDKKTKEITEPAIPDPRFPIIPNRKTRVVMDAPSLEREC